MDQELALRLVLGAAAKYHARRAIVLGAEETELSPTALDNG